MNGIYISPGADYPSREQALASAFAESAVGEEVVEHYMNCNIREPYEECECRPVIWRKTETGWTAQ